MVNRHSKKVIDRRIAKGGSQNETRQAMAWLDECREIELELSLQLTRGKEE